ncbi:MAG: 50S ribosomal protein L5 [Bacteroidetes bacterium]|nr:50S ribosomal protein L5 [Bacteroidota bacterium]
MKPRLAELYKSKIVPDLMKKNNYSNIMEVPKITKISLNMGLGAATQDAKILEVAVKELGIVCGQKPIVTKAKKAISNFKLRENMPIGAKVTLRGDTMYEFLDRLINLAMPRIRDFRGVSDKSFDGFGNYTFGVKEQIIFPEINVDQVDRIVGMDITIVTTAKTDAEAYDLLKSFSFPFRKRNEN